MFSLPDCRVRRCLVGWPALQRRYPEKNHISVTFLKYELKANTAHYLFCRRSDDHCNCANKRLQRWIKLKLLSRSRTLVQSCSVSISRLEVGVHLSCGVYPEVPQQDVLQSADAGAGCGIQGIAQDK